eukprot:scaffold55927_cov63-Phaeocystis_antarctica.AAC.8
MAANEACAPFRPRPERRCRRQSSESAVHVLVTTPARASMLVPMTTGLATGDLESSEPVVSVSCFHSACGLASPMRACSRSAQRTP